MILQLVIFLYLVINSGALGKYMRIVGGQNADIKDYPYMVALKKVSSKQQFCGGIIISSRHILTAAHCFDKYSYKNIKVYVGSNLRHSSGPSYRLLEVDIHHGYTGKLTRQNCLYNDIAVATIDGCIRFNKFVNKIKLPIRNVQAGTGSKTLGWGVTSYPVGSPSEILQVAPMTIFNNELCIKAVSYALHPGQVCAFDRRGSGTCVGDSGGPLVSDAGELIGITSFCYLCALGLPDVYTRIYYYRDFIEGILDASHFPSCTIS